MRTELDPKEILNRLSAAEFKKNNGIVMRGVALGFPYRWFTVRDLEMVIQNRISEQEVKKTIVYLTDEGYLKYRSITGEKVRDVVDFELSDLEFRLAPRGTRLIEFVEKNELIEL